MLVRDSSYRAWRTRSSATCGRAALTRGGRTRRPRLRFGDYVYADRTHLFERSLDVARIQFHAATRVAHHMRAQAERHSVARGPQHAIVRREAADEHIRDLA